MRLKILTHRDPVVRRRADPVDPTWLMTPAAVTLIRDMRDTMHAANGIGLAAPQIGRSIRLVTIAFKDGDLIMANPDIVRPSLKRSLEEEGCLSVPGVFGRVRRHQSLTVRFLDEHGKPQTLAASGLFARVVQHECDHLNGVVYIDRTSDFTQGRP